MRKCKLKDLIEVTRGASLAGEYYSTEGELVRLTLGNFDYNNGGFKENISKEDIFFVGDVKKEFILDKGDIITPLTEQAIGLLGTTARIPESGKYIQSQDVALVRCKENLYPGYCYYLLPSYIVKKQLSAGAQQTSIRHTSPDKIKDCWVYIPEYNEQKKIAEFLDNIDRKITLNRKMNATLEAMAKQLYDYWFVQFDFPNAEGKPYKSSGGKMVWNEKLKREIPEGWGNCTLLDIAEFTNGIACQNYRPQNEDKLRVIKIKEMHNGFTEETEYVRSEVSSEIKVYNGDILFSWSASLEVMMWTGGVGALNQHIFKVTSKNGYPRSYYYYQLLDYVSTFQRMAEARKTTMGHITQDHLRQSVIAVPSNLSLLNVFEQKTKYIFDLIIKLNEEITTLTTLRDYLLPLLMNGQVQIKES